MDVMNQEKITLNQISSPQASALPEGLTLEELDYQKKQEPEYLAAVLEEQKTKIKELTIRNDILSHYLNTLIIDKWMRLICIPLLFLGVAYFVYMVFDLVKHQHSYPISDQVLMAIVGSVSINIVGLLAIVLKFLFSSAHHKILDGYNKM